MHQQMDVHGLLLLWLLLLQCGDGYDPEVCKHDLRPECDYHQYKDGEYPPEDCHPYKVGCSNTCQSDTDRKTDRHRQTHRQTGRGRQRQTDNGSFHL
jgi:hypothetical protein